ncbi:MAG: hypothetical protein EPN51_04095 [Mycobacterium sp.]|nr:MAG: hypothetical protein EPN51_04095 [Mycobacterium sp.]
MEPEHGHSSGARVQRLRGGAARPAVVPGGRLNDAVLDYLCSGAGADMNLPEAADQSRGGFAACTQKIAGR